MLLSWDRNLFVLSVERKVKKIPIDFNKIAKQSCKRKGTIYYSPTFKSWVVDDGNLPLAMISAPKGAKRVENNMWIIETF